MLKIFILSALMMIPATSACIEITSNLNNDLYTNVEYTKPFRVTNEFYPNTTGVNLTIKYNISSGSYFKENNSELTGLNKYKTAGTGNIIFSDAGNYSICGKVTSNTLCNTSSAICTDHIINEIREVKCNQTISITTDKDKYNDEEKIEFRIENSNESYPYIITYWIEDFLGEIRKNPVETKNSNSRSYTIDEDSLLSIYTIRANLTAYCNNTGTDYAEKQVMIFSSISNATELDIKWINTEQTSEEAIISADISFYSGNHSDCRIKTFIADKNKKKISTYEYIDIEKKYSNTKKQVIHVLKNNKIKSEIHFLIIDGCEAEKTEEIRLKMPEIENKEEKTEAKKYSNIKIEILDLPQKVVRNKSFTSRLRITNNEDKDKTIYVTNKVFRNSKCYCANCKEEKISVPGLTSNTYQFNNIAGEVRNETYNIGIAIRAGKETILDYKTDVIGYAPAREIKVIEEINHNKTKTKNENNNTDKAEMGIPTGKVIYESDNIKRKTWISNMLIIVLTIMSVGLLFRKRL